MGFFDKFLDTWSDWHTNWSKTGRDIAAGGSDFLSGIKSMGAGLVNMMLLPVDPDKAKAGAKKFLEGGMTTAGGAGGFLGGAMDVPVLRQLGNTVDWLQTELVRRPEATLNLVGGDALKAGSPLSSQFWSKFTTGDEWRQAYNSSAHVTTGQAMMWSAARAAQYFTSGDVETVAPDPRVNRAAYLKDPVLKFGSGLADATVVMLEDPTIFGGKVTKWAKLKYLSKPMNAAAIRKGTHLAYMDSRRYEKVYEFIRKAKSPDDVTMRLFNDASNGGLVSNLLWSVADDRALYDTTFRAAYGDPRAWDDLTRNAERIADMTGSRYARYTIAQAAKNHGLGDEAADAMVKSLTETKVQAFADAIVNGRGAWGALSPEKGGALTGATLPRLTLTSKWRTGVHQWVAYAPQVKLGMWARRSRWLLPSAKTSRMIDLWENSPSAVKLVRANLETSRLPLERVSYWTSAYSRATSPESRGRILAAAEDEAFTAHAKRYGLTTDQIEKDMLPAINRYRTSNRQLMSANRRYLSADMRDLAQKRLAENAPDAAEQAQAFNHAADQIDAAVRRGDMPAAVHAGLDEDGNLALIPSAGEIDALGPILSSQHGRVSPMMDWNVLENALWWNTRGGFGKHVYEGVDLTRAGLDTINSVWKISAIMRPGYIWRAVSDELGRVVAVQDTMRVLSGAVAGVKHAGYNMVGRAGLAAEAVDAAVTGRRAMGEGDNEELAHRVADEAAAVPSELADRRTLARGADITVTGTPLPQVGDVYTSYERALADGLISPDAFLERVAAHGDAGTLPLRLAGFWNGRREDTMAERLYRRKVIDDAMNQVGRGAYTSPTWQWATLRAIVDTHARKPLGQPGAPVLIDPFTGTSPAKPARELMEQMTVRKSTDITPTGGAFQPDDLYGFIADNIDDLLKPGALMSAYVTPAGRISLGVAAANPDAARMLALKPGAGRRLDIPFSRIKGRAYRDSGSAKWSVGGYTLHGAFEGQAGDLLRHEVSSRGPEDAFVDALTNTEHARLMAQSGRWVDVAPKDPGYGTQWERAVNLQLANDEVARQFLAGASHGDVMAWMRNTEAGRAYQAKMGPWASRYAEQAHIVSAMVDTLAPIVEGKEADSMKLRELVLKGRATFDDFKKIMDVENMPRVHGASLESATGTGAFMDRVRKVTNNIFKLLSDMPNDKFVRYPFAAEQYRTHVTDLLRNRQNWLEGKQTLSEHDLAAIEGEARRRALGDVHKYLYESAAEFDLAKSARLLVPFGGAIADSTVKWGVALREKPWKLVNLWKIWSAPDKSGLVQDEDGNHLVVENGRDVWYSVNPDTGERTRLDNHNPKQRFVVFRLPFGLQPDYGKGVKAVTRIDKNVFRTFLDIPMMGPMVAVPASNFSLEHPEFADNGFVRRFVLPYGPSADWRRVALPGNIRNLWDSWVSEDKDEAQQQAITIYATEMARYAQGQRLTQPTFEEVRQRAADLRGVRFWYRFSGVSAQFQSPYQPYIDYYHMLQQQDPTTADARFYDDVGQEFFWLTSRVTRNALGLPATVGAFNSYKKFGTLMQQYPDLAPLIAGAEGAGEFSKAVYEAQRIMPLRPGSGKTQRELLSFDDSIEDVQRRAGWAKYTRFMDALHADMVDRGVTSLQSKAARDLKANRDRFIDNNMYTTGAYGERTISPWYKDFTTLDSAQMAERLAALAEIVKDRRLQGRDDIRGLVDYLYVRRQFKSEMAARGFASLNSKKAAAMSRMWDDRVFGLKDSNMSFAQLHNRWLSSDDLTA